ncbi:hypothetical protein AOT82_1524 [Psychrobacter sp. AntiMn-1]|nr:hypothetical protein AOT82_1524 [Psychrobacter sp. AntiMn-1]
MLGDGSVIISVPKRPIDQSSKSMQPSRYLDVIKKLARA